MHLFLGAIGFKGIDSKSQEENLIKHIVKNALANKSIMYHKENNAGVIIEMVNSAAGVCIKGEYNGKERFKPEYYFPFALGNTVCSNEEISIERHAALDSYAVVCEEIKAGVTLICYLQNIMDYYRYAYDKKNITGRTIKLSALSRAGMVLLPVNKSEKQIKKYKQDMAVRSSLIAAARRGDEEAIENLTIDDLDTYSQLSRRIMKEDVFTIVDTSFMPCGVECDQYAVVGDILSVSQLTNSMTNEEIYYMTLDCNDVILDMAINKEDLLGEPQVGRRFKGQIWLSCHVNFE